MIVPETLSYRKYMSRLHKLDMTRDQNEKYADHFSKMMNRSRKVGYLNTGDIINSGIHTGHVLEVGPGPGILGINWLEKTENTRLTGLDICEEMIRNAKANAEKILNGLKRTDYVVGNAEAMPFADHVFDAVFSNSSFHEWEQPQKVLAEIRRVLKPGARFYISDFRRDIEKAYQYFILATTMKELRKELRESINEAYNKEETEALFYKCGYQDFVVELTPFSLTVKGVIKE